MSRIEDLRDTVDRQAIQIEDLKEIVDRNVILLEMLFHTTMKHGTDKVFTSPSLPLRRRNFSPPPAPRKRSRSPVARTRYSDTDVFIRGWLSDVSEEEFTNYLFDEYDICVSGCTIYKEKYCARVTLNSNEAQLKLLDNAKDISKYFKFKELIKSKL